VFETNTWKEWMSENKISVRVEKLSFHFTWQDVNVYFLNIFAFTIFTFYARFKFIHEKKNTKKVVRVKMAQGHVESCIFPCLCSFLSMYRNFLYIFFFIIAFVQQTFKLFRMEWKISGSLRLKRWSVKWTNKKKFSFLMV
jgi:hypothetical protein